MSRVQRVGVVDAKAYSAAPRRVEGRDKVMGRALYAGDLNSAKLEQDTDVAVAVTSTQATGTILAIDTEQALESPGVRAVLTHENAPRLHKVISVNGTEIGDILPLQEAKLHYAGQCIALVIADTLENARTAALLVSVRYSAPEAAPAFTLEQGMNRAKDAKMVGSLEKGQEKLGNAEKAFTAAAYQADLTFETSPHHHNAMEPGAIVASWEEDGGLTVRLPTQFTYGDAVLLGEAFGFGLKDRLPRIIGQVLGGVQFDNKVRVISTLAGGAFGGKQGNIHLLLAPLAAKVTGRSVKLVLTREQTFSLMPFRGATRQRLRLGADGTGKLTALMQDGVMAQGAGGSYVEPVGENTMKVYACPNIKVHSQSARLDTGAPGWMRGPGASLGQFAVEVSMDALAEKIGMDPLDFRLRNYAEVEPDTGHEWSSKSLKECYEAAGRRIGWFERDPRVGSMREGRHLVGFGMATSIYPTQQLPAVARIILRSDGHATVQSSVHEIGQGMLTVMTQIAAERLGLPLDNVHLEWGDTALPYGSMAVGSMGALSNGASIAEAADLVMRDLFKREVKDPASALYRQHQHDLEVAGESIAAPDGTTVKVIDAARRLSEPIEEEAISGRPPQVPSLPHKYGRSAFGAQFVKVRIDPDTMHVQVERLVGAFAGGRALNPMLVRNQLLGSMIWGLGQALIEESMIDTRTGIWMNSNLGEALVPVNADIADVEAIIIEEDDTRGHPLGVKGMGEVGTIGTAAAVSNAIYHATGKRFCSLPIKIDDLLREN